MGDYAGRWEPAPAILRVRSDRLADELIRDFELVPGDSIYIADRCYTVVEEGGNYFEVEKIAQYQDDFGTIPSLTVTGAIGTPRLPFNLGGPTDVNDGSREIFMRDEAEIRNALEARRAAEKTSPATPFSSALTAATDALARNLIAELELSGLDAAQVGKITYDVSSTKQQGGGTKYLRAYPSKLPRNTVLLSSGIAIAGVGSLNNEPLREQLLTDYAELRAAFQQKVARHHLNDVPAAKAPATRRLPGQ